MVKLLHVMWVPNIKSNTVTGKTVILAARLEQFNKEFNSSVIVSKDVIDNMKRAYKITYTQEMIIRRVLSGKNKQ